MPRAPCVPSRLSKTTMPLVSGVPSSRVTLPRTGYLPEPQPQDTNRATTNQASRHRSIMTASIFGPSPYVTNRSVEGRVDQAVVHAGQGRQGAAADRPLDGLDAAVAEGEQHAAGVRAAELADERVVGAQRQGEAGPGLPAAGLPGRPAAGVVDAAVARPLADL